MSSQPTSSSVTRRRTPQQLRRKRMLDKESQRLKRMKEKDEQFRVHNSLNYMRHTIDSLRQMVQSLTKTTEPPRLLDFHPADSDFWLAPALHDSLSDAESAERSAANVPLFISPERTAISLLAQNNTPAFVSELKDQGWALHSSLAHCAGPPPAPTDMTRASYQPTSPVSSKNSFGEPISTTLAAPDDYSPFSVEDLEAHQVACLCVPKRHVSYWDCFELTIYDALIQWHNRSHTPPNIPLIPRTPTLSDLLFLGDGENIVSAVLNKLLKPHNFRSLSELLGIYIHLYLLFRYRFFPSLESFQDIPEWLRPTEIQDNTPHAISHDAIAFPQLKIAMILGTIKFDRVEFDRDYLEHISVGWPESKNILARDKDGTVILHPDFEVHVLDAENWTLSLDFAIKYPQMAQLVNIRST